MPSSRKALTVLVVEDEPLGCKRLVDLLARVPGWDVAGTASDGEEAVDAIRAIRPDLVLLDIQLPRMTGLEVVEEVGPMNMPATIFVTAYREHAVRAFELAAVDYLVKPFTDERFEETMNRARRRLDLEGLEGAREQILTLLERGVNVEPHLPPKAAYLERIAVQSKGKVRVVSVAKIEYIQASGYCAELHTAAERHVIRESLQSLEHQLDPEQFVRVHRSAIVRLECVDSILVAEGGDYDILLKSGARIPMSRYRRAEVKRRLGRSA
jgi:two-component system, LytTR family, response regulator